MSDANTTANAASTAAAGLGAFVLSALNLPAGLLSWSLAGAVIGLGLAPPGKNKVHDFAVFVAVTIGAAKLGSVAGVYLWPAIPEAKDACAFLIACLFHPLYGQAVRALPAVVDAVAARIGSRQ